jgi:hypothetical protein
MAAIIKLEAAFVFLLIIPADRLSCFIRLVGLGESNAATLAGSKDLANSRDSDKDGYIS